MTYVKADGTLTEDDVWYADDPLVRVDLSVLVDGLSVWVQPGQGGHAFGVPHRSAMPRDGDLTRSQEDNFR